MKVSILACSYQLTFRHPFRIQHGLRFGTDVVYVKLICGHLHAFGEAALPPYLPENTASVLRDLKTIQDADLLDIHHPAQSHAALSQLLDNRTAALAAVDMAMWRLHAAERHTTLSDCLGTVGRSDTPHSFTLGIGSREEMRKKMDEADHSLFSFFKIKLNGIDDDRIINDYLAITNDPFAVDVNEGWKNCHDALPFAHALQRAGCMMIEQPFHRSDRLESRQLAEALDIPIIADEAFWRRSELDDISNAFDAINIKLRKCAGLTEAADIILMAREKKLRVLIGCMSESSVACQAAEALAPLCDWADLDGPWLISNDPNPEMLLFSALESFQ